MRTWNMAFRSLGIPFIPTKRGFQTKRNLDRSVERFKPRFVAEDFEKNGFHFDKVYALVAKYTTLSALLALSALPRWSFNLPSKTLF